MLKDVVVKVWDVAKKGEGFIVYESPARCPSNVPPRPAGWEVFDCGGAYPHFVVYDPRKIEVLWLTSPKVSQYRAGSLEVEGEVVAEVSASVHGCWKLRHNQMVLVVRKPEDKQKSPPVTDLSFVSKVLVDTLKKKFSGDDIPETITSTEAKELFIEEDAEFFACKHYIDSYSKVKLVKIIDIAGNPLFVWMGFHQRSLDEWNPEKEYFYVGLWVNSDINDPHSGWQRYAVYSFKDWPTDDDSPETIGRLKTDVVELKKENK